MNGVMCLSVIIRQSVAGASVVNIVLDCIAVFVLGMGIKGAAIATTAAQWTGLAFLFKQVLDDGLQYYHGPLMSRAAVAVAS